MGRPWAPSLVLVGLALGGCDDEGQRAKQLERTLDHAEDAVSRAGRGVRAGYKKAEGRVKSVDWVDAFEDTKKKAKSAAEKLGLDRAPAPDQEPGGPRWWERGAEAVHCDEPATVCEVEGWYLSAARRRPTRLTGDVKVLTALDDSGWLLDAVEPKSAAHAMGFRRGDVVTTVAGRPLTDSWARLEILEAMRTQSEVVVRYKKGGQQPERTLTVKLLDPPPPASD